MFVHSYQMLSAQQKIPSSLSDMQTRKRKSAKNNHRGHDDYTLNLNSVLSSTLNGGSHLYLQLTTELLGVPCMSFPQKALYMTQSTKHQKNQCRLHLPKNFCYAASTMIQASSGEIKGLQIMVDMGLQKRASERLYNSPSGVIHIIGGNTGKIMYSFIHLH